MDAARITEVRRVIAMPMRLAARALHVIAEQQHTRSAEYAGQVDCLMPAIHAMQDSVRVLVDTFARGSANPVQTELVARLLAARPQLARKLRAH